MAKLTAVKVLQSQGFGSRAECTAIIKEKRLQIDERPVTNPDELLNCEAIKSIRIDNTDWPYYEKLYLVLNKPAGWECSQKPSHHPSVFELFPPQFVRRGIQSAGRLDWDTEGLLIFTDDGQCIHGLTSPKKLVSKTYRAATARPVTDSFLAALREGVLLRDEANATAALECRKISDYDIELVIDEGKYHQVRRMIAAAGNHCVRLERTAVGGLRLEDLHIERGQWCYLSVELLAAAGYQPR
ncbi:MAG: pseudouridine synthase [Treponema sp.]|nr:pseudouridine synthase [Treponema sp.]